MTRISSEASINSRTPKGSSLTSAAASPAAIKSFELMRGPYRAESEALIRSGLRAGAERSLVQIQSPRIDSDTQYAFTRAVADARAPGRRPNTTHGRGLASLNRPWQMQ